MMYTRRRLSIVVELKVDDAHPTTILGRNFANGHGLTLNTELSRLFTDTCFLSLNDSTYFIQLSLNFTTFELDRRRCRRRGRWWYFFELTTHHFSTEIFLDCLAKSRHIKLLCSAAATRLV